MASAKAAFGKSVFINCPFDKKYKPLRDAAVFTLTYCGFKPRLASESSDSLQVRIDKITDLIKNSRYSIHDLCRMDAKKKGDLARFNMPFELGIDFGCRVFGARNASSKRCLIFDTERYRYAKALSDLAGVDIKEHQEDPEKFVYQLRSWIRNTLKIKIESGTTIWRQYLIFSGDFKQIMKVEGFKKKDVDEMEPNEYIDFIGDWLQGKKN